MHRAAPSTPAARTLWQRGIGLGALLLFCCSEAYDDEIVVMLMGAAAEDCRSHRFGRAGILGAVDLDGDGADEILASTPAALGFLRPDGTGRRLAGPEFGAALAWVPLADGEAQLLTVKDRGTLQDLRCTIDVAPACRHFASLDLPGISTSMLATGDFVEDGRVDLAIVREDGSLRLVEQLGPPADPDALAARVGFEMAIDGPRSIASADADDDGHFDLVTAEGAITVHFGDGAGGWAEPVPVGDAGRGEFGREVRFARLGDGLVHVVTGNRVHFNNGDRTFGPAVVPDEETEMLFPGDFDPEEGLELLAFREGEPKILMLDADREWRARAIDSPDVQGDRTFGALGVVGGDFDGDAIDDLAFHFAVLDERGCDPDDPF